MKPELARKLIEQREFFNERKADKETIEFRKIVNKHKEDIYLTEIKIAKRTLYFGGAGDHKIMLFELVPGEDIKKYTVKKSWIVWGNENPIIRKQLLKAIDELYEEDKNVFAYSPEEFMEYSEEFTKASEI